MSEAAPGMRGMFGRYQATLMRVGMPTAAFVAVGISGFVLLAAGPRLLGATTYALLAVAWTVVQAIGVGIAAPSEQTVSRAVASNVGGILVTKVRRRLLAVTSVTLLVPLAGAVGLDPVFGGGQLWAWSLVLAAGGWAYAAPARGELAGSGRFGSYSATVFIEAIVRVAVVAVAWFWPTLAAPALASGLWLPMWAAAAAAGILSHRHRDPVARQPGSAAIADSLSHQGPFTAVSVAGQVSLGFGTVWLQSQYPQSGVAGQYVTATTYMRIPIVLVGGLVVVVLSAAASAFAADDWPRVRAVVGKATAGTALFAPAATGVLLAISGPALLAFYGQQLSLGMPTMLAMAAATVAAMLAGVVTQSAFATGLGMWAARTWTVAALLSIGWSVLGGDSTFELAMAVAAGQALAASVIGVRLWSLLAAQPKPARRPAESSEPAA